MSLQLPCLWQFALALVGPVCDRRGTHTALHVDFACLMCGAACRGPYIDLLQDLGKEHMGKLQNSATSFTKEQDRELILRFFAMRNKLQDLKPPLSRFLNNEIRQHQHILKPKAQEYTKLFRRTFLLVRRQCSVCTGHSVWKLCLIKYTVSREAIWMDTWQCRP